MGYYCRECETYRRNEAFSGKGRKRHICKRCIKHRDYRGEIHSWLRESELSLAHMKRLRKFMHMSNESTTELADLIYRVGEVAPKKAGRIETLQNIKPELLSELESAGLLEMMKVSEDCVG